MADDKPKNADFIGRVVTDAKNPTETRMLSGWFGDSGEKGTRRLYTDAELTSYVDIPDDAILYSEPIKDAQPSGGVIVWIKRDAAVQSGGSAASRAARFLQGQVQQDFASGKAGSLEKAGLRCVTDVPCGEPTGFTGRCTKQPDVGGGWPCITAIPHCAEVTGFTGKCTHQPWPNPTRYYGCTYLHCPTNDLTHNPQICNLVASGMPGCVVVNPPQGGDVEKKAGAADANAIAETSLPGCGYTKTWGVCETHLLGCGYTKEWGQCHTQPPLCDPVGPQGNAAFAAAQQLRPVGPVITPLCNPSVLINCLSQIDACPSRLCDQTKAPTELCTPAPGVCNTFCGPQCQTNQVQPVCTSVNCMTPAGQACPPPPTPQLECTMICTQVGPHCPTIDSPLCNINVPVAQGLGAPQRAAGGQQTLATVCTQFGCQTYPNGDCTFFGCQHTHYGRGCPPTPATVCTQFAPCPTHHLPCPSPGIDCTVICTHIGPQCPTPLCPQQGTGVQCFQPPHTSPPQCPILSGFNCPSQICHSLGCVSQACQPPGGLEQQQFAQQAVGGQQTLATVCTQFGCQTYPNGDCTFFGCPRTHSGPGCPPTPATVCTQFAPCPTHHIPCVSPGIDCTVLCTHVGPGCHTHQIGCPTKFECTFACPPQRTGVECFQPLTAPPQCPIASGVNCPSNFCQSIACQQSQACQPAGGGIEQQHAVGARQSIAFPCHLVPSHLAACKPTIEGLLCLHTVQGWQCFQPPHSWICG